MNVRTFLAARGGTTSTAELARAGFSRSQLNRALAESTMVRIRRGHYGTPQDASAHRAARELGAKLTCVSAAPSYGLWTLVPVQRLHLWVGHRSAPAEQRERRRRLPGPPGTATTTSSITRNGWSPR